MRIGSHTTPNDVVLAPMAGVTDRPFRQLARRLGAGLVVGEMTSSNPRVWGTQKSRLRLAHAGEPGPISVQIAGGDPEALAEAARMNVEAGAEIIDINMGCPCKKVCNKAAGSALLKDEDLVARILAAVVAASSVPVTLKIRTGWDREHRNGVRIARLAEDAGIRALAVHGRTRADLFEGEAEYDTLRAIKQAVRIPVIANGDIDSPQKARAVLDYTGADAVMIGRAAQGRPWLMGQVAEFLATGTHAPDPDAATVRDLLLEHLEALYAFYGETTGLRVARKHIAWYLEANADHAAMRAFRARVVRVESAAEQTRLVRHYFDGTLTDIAPLNPEELAA
jgi:tRNA-dihydrouridine synthase B